MDPGGGQVHHCAVSANADSDQWAHIRIFQLRRISGMVCAATAVAPMDGASDISRDGGRWQRWAMVGTDFDWFGEALPAQSERDHITDVLFARTRSAADAGARLIVWNEVSNIIFPAEEQHMLKRAAAVAREYNSEVVMSFLVALEVSPLRVENKLIRVAPNGEVADIHLKQKRVPGEPSVRGTAASQVTDSAIGRLGGAICYDFDFPQVARQLAVDRTDIAYVPSSGNQAQNGERASESAGEREEQAEKGVRSERAGR